MSFLEIRQVSHWFGGLQALKDVSFQTRERNIGFNWT